MLRVLHIVTYMGRGGLETMIMNYYRQIDRSQIQFDFLVHRQDRSDYDDEIERLGGKIFRLPRLNPVSAGYHHKLMAFFKEHPEYRVVHCHLDCMSSIPLAAAKKAGIPILIAHSHNANQNKDLKYPLKLWYKRRIPNNATKLFACSEAAGKWMFNNSPFEVFPNAIQTQEFVYNPTKRLEVRKELGLEDQIVFGHVGRFNPQKNHSFLIEVFSRIHDKLPDSKLLLVGGGDGEEEIRNKVRSLNLSGSVIFTGIRSDVADLLQAMDVFLFPSLFEGLGIVGIEAQAAGLPCVISDGIPKECIVTDLVNQVSLSAGTEKWAETAIAAIGCQRQNTYNEICAAGFDISENAKRLQNFYIRAASGETDLCL